MVNRHIGTLQEVFDEEADEFVALGLRVEVGQEFGDLIANDLLLVRVSEEDHLVGSRHVAVVNQVTNLLVHRCGVNDVLRILVDALSHLRHQAKPYLPRHDLVDFRDAALELFALQLAWVAIVRLEDDFVESVAVLRLFDRNLGWVEEFFTALLDQLVRLSGELLHEIGRLLAARVHDTSLHAANVLLDLKLDRLVDSLELVRHFLLLALPFFDLLSMVLTNLLNQNVRHSLVQEVIVGLGHLLEELGDEGVGRARIVDSLLGNINLAADLGEQSAARLVVLVDFFAADESTGPREVSFFNHDEATCGTSLPLVVLLGLGGEGLEDLQERRVGVLLDDNDVS